MGMLRSEASRKMWTVAAAALLAAIAAAFAVSTGALSGSAQAQDSTGPARWSVEVEGVGSVLFRDVEGLGTSLNVVQSRSDGSRLNVKAAGKGSASNIVLRRDLSEDTGLYDWHRHVVVNGTSGTREDGTITLYDGTGTPVATFEFTKGWPARYRVVEEDESGLVVEVVTLAVNDLRRVE